MRGCDVEQARSDDAAHVAGKSIGIYSRHPSRELCEALFVAVKSRTFGILLASPSGFAEGGSEWDHPPHGLDK